jgi:hypothetical protein
LRAIAGPEFGQEAADVGAGGRRAEVEVGGDLVVGEAAGDEDEDFAFACGDGGEGGVGVREGVP